VFPTYMEYLAVKKAVKKASAGSDAADIRRTFENASQVDDIKSVLAKDLKINKGAGDKWVVSFDYVQEIHLAGPAYLSMKYKGTSLD
jgi:hypothetical protein